MFAIVNFTGHFHSYSAQIQRNMDQRLLQYRSLPNATER